MSKAKSETVEAKVCAIVAEQMSMDEKDITANASLVDDLGMDSLDLVELVMTCEETFEFDTDEEEAERCKTFGDIVNMVEAKRKKP